MNNNKTNVYIDSTNPHFSRKITAVLNQSGIKAEEMAMPKNKTELLAWIWKIKKSKASIIHFLWGGRNPVIYAIPKLLGKKVIIHWIGKDVSNVKNRSRLKLTFQKIAFNVADKHLTDFEPLQSELKDLGIESEVVTLFPNINQEKKIVWPQGNRVHIYLPENDHEFYGSNTVFRLIKEMSDVEFLITGHSGRNAPNLPNVQYLGWIDDLDSRVWNKVKVYIRLIKYDGLSHSVVEALSRGKHVIWTYKFPHCFKARDFEETKNALREIFKKDKSNIEGARYAQSQFTLSKTVKSFKRIYKEL